MNPKMDIIVNGGRDRKVYPGSSETHVSSTLPEYRGNTTMTFRYAPTMTQKTSAIIVDPNIRGGVPCVGNAQWPITRILQILASGISMNQLVRSTPELTYEDIKLALDAAAWVMRDPSINWPLLDISNMVNFHSEMQSWQRLSDEVLGHSEDIMED